jgi:hypothetical protein
MYVGAAEKQQLKERLKGAAAPEIISFCLEGIDGVRPNTGANRNALMLSTLDERIFSVDDDTLNATFDWPGDRRRKLRVTSFGWIEEHVCFRDVSEIMRNLHTTPQDCLGIHERILSRSIRSLLDEFGLDLDCSGREVSPFLLQILQNEAAHTVVVILMSGVVGDSGAHSQVGLLGL